MTEECLSCGCGFGPGVSKVYVHQDNKTVREMRAFNHVFFEPVKCGKDVLCPSCFTLEQRRGYCLHSNTTFLVWNEKRFVEVRLLSAKRVNEAIEAMAKMSLAERRKYLLEKAAPKP